MSSNAPSPSPTPAPADGDGPVRLFHVWPGRNRFLCGGVCITGPDRRWPLGTLALLLVPSALFLGFVAADFVDRGDEWVMAVAVVTLCMTLLSFGWTSLSDPGIVPRQTDANKSSAGRQVPRTQNAVVNGRPASLKFCPTCNIYRPPRAVHCSVCDNCVEVFDHHCPWVGNCVGKGNYRAFMSFLFWCTTYVVFVLAMSVRHMVVYTQDERDADDSLSGGEAFGEALARNPVSLITALLSFLFFWFPLGLFSFHIYLTCTGQSTNEMLKGAFPFGSPYSRGGCHNWTGLCCRLPEPGHFRRRTKVDPKTKVPLKAPRVVMLEVIPDPNSPRSRSASAPPRPVAAGNSRPGSPIPGPLSRAPTTEGPRLDGAQDRTPAASRA